jgi:hypothetical protein
MVFAKIPQVGVGIAPAVDDPPAAQTSAPGQTPRPGDAGGDGLSFSVREGAGVKTAFAEAKRRDLAQNA